jgi:hypothetical protein
MDTEFKNLINRTVKHVTPFQPSIRTREFSPHLSSINDALNHVKNYQKDIALRMMQERFPGSYTLEQYFHFGRYFYKVKWTGNEADYTFWMLKYS